MNHKAHEDNKARFASITTQKVLTTCVCLMWFGAM
jgi:hypothetical protein